MNNMKECFCVNDYSVKAMKYSGGGKHSNVYDKVIFQTNQVYVYDVIDSVYYVATDKKYLKHKNDYNTEVYDMDVNEFNQHFIKK